MQTRFQFRFESRFRFALTPAVKLAQDRARHFVLNLALQRMSIRMINVIASLSDPASVALHPGTQFPNRVRREACIV